MDLVLSSLKSIDRLLSMNHWHSDENSLFSAFKFQFSTFLIFNVLMLVENKGVICIQEPASDNDQRKSFTYNRKKSGRRIEPCGTLDFNVPASEKTLSIQTKNQKFSVSEIGLKPLDTLHEVLAQQFLVAWLVNLLVASGSFSCRSLANSEQNLWKVFVFPSASNQILPSFIREIFSDFFQFIPVLSQFFIKVRFLLHQYHFRQVHFNESKIILFTEFILSLYC